MALDSCLLATKIKKGLFQHWHTSGKHLPRLATMATIPFDEIVPGATARLAVIENVQYLSIRDVIMHLGGHSSKTANKTWERFSPDARQELGTFCRQFRFPGPGNPIPADVITFKGALKLAMMIGGENAKKYRSAMVSILQRYYAGDGSLLEEVEANAQSAGPVQQMARASLVAEAVPVAVEEDLALPCKKRRMELEMARMEADIEAKRIANRAAELANIASERDSAREHMARITTNYRELCEDKVMDERARLILKDGFLNMAMLQGSSSSVIPAAGTGQGLISNGKPISLSMVADQLGLKIPSNELISIGQELKKLYVERNGRAPSKHEQLCGGRATMVNTYMEGDRPLLEEVLRRHAASTG